MIPCPICSEPCPGHYRPDGSLIQGATVPMPKSECVYCPDCQTCGGRLEIDNVTEGTR